MFGFSSNWISLDESSCLKHAKLTNGVYNRFPAVEKTNYVATYISVYSNEQTEENLGSEITGDRIPR
jgi:hypothetical protein